MTETQALRRPSDIAASLLAGEVSPQELGLTCDGIGLLLATAEPDAATAPIVTEALAAVERAIRQPNNPAIKAWLTETLARTSTARALLAHIRAVNQLYAVIVALRPQPG